MPHSMLAPSVRGQHSRVWLPIVLCVGLLVPVGDAAPSARTVAHQASATVRHARVFHLERGTDFAAVHWPAARAARVTVAWGRDVRHLGPAQRVLLDEAGEGARGRETYGQLVALHGARVLRVTTSRSLRRMTVLALDDRGVAVPVRRVASSAAVAQPKVIPRIDWGADESLRYSAGTEVWPPAFYPVQKLIVHHTATSNADANPAATIRSIYYYHAITQGWGDIGYNVLIDESGRVYEGRHTFDYPSGSSPTEEDPSDNGVTAAHTQGYNSGTVGIALLGTLTNQDVTPAARSALESLLAWETGHHGIDPLGATLYTNPVSGTQATFANIAGHRDLGATECPGGAFYATLPTIRSDVAALNSGSGPIVTRPTAATGSASAIT